MAPTVGGTPRRTPMKSSRGMEPRIRKAPGLGNSEPGNGEKSMASGSAKHGTRVQSTLPASCSPGCGAGTERRPAGACVALLMTATSRSPLLDGPERQQTPAAAERGCGRHARITH